MNVKKFVIASIVVAVVAYALDFLLHGLILMDAYKAHPDLFGSMEQMTKWMWLLPIGYFSLTFVMGYIFIKGYEGKGLMEGLRFGLMMGLFMQVPRFVFEVVYLPYPKIFDIVNLVGGMVEFLIFGILFAVIYKPLPKSK